MFYYLKFFIFINHNMLDEYYDLQKNASELINENKQEIENLNKNLELSLFEIEKPIRKPDFMIKYISNIKKELIKKGYLDYINTENYTIYTEIRKEIFNQEFNTSILLDFNEMKNIFLKNENLIFYSILEKMEENEYLAFLVNYDFLEKGIKINYDKIEEIYYNTNQKKISEEEMEFQIKNIKIKNQEEEDLIQNIHRKYDNYINKKEDYIININNLISEINKLKVLNNEISINEILKFEEDFFLKGIEKSKYQLKGLLEEFIYENQIQEFISNKKKK